MWTKSTLSVHRLYSKCPPLAWTHARCLPRHWSIVSSKIDCSRPLRQWWAAVSIHPHYGFICGKHDAAWHSPDLVVHRTEIWAVWRPQVGRKKVWRFLTQQFSCCKYEARCAGALSCWDKVVTRHSVYRWQQYDVIMMSWSSIEEVSKRYHQNFLLSTTMKLP